MPNLMPNLYIKILGDKGAIVMFCRIDMTNIQHAVTTQAPFKVT